VSLSPAVRFASPGLTIDSDLVRWHLSQMNVVATLTRLIAQARSQFLYFIEHSAGTSGD